MSNYRKSRVYTQTKSKRRIRRLVKLRFDAVSKIHVFTRSCVLQSYKRVNRTHPLIVYYSTGKVISSLITKRALLQKVRNYKSCNQYASLNNKNLASGLDNISKKWFFREAVPPPLGKPSGVNLDYRRPIQIEHNLDGYVGAMYPSKG